VMHDGTDSVGGLCGTGERISDLRQIRRVSIQQTLRDTDAVARRRYGLVDLMRNGGTELPHRHDAVRVRQLHLRFAQLPLAADDLQGNGRLRGEVRDHLDLTLRKGLYALPPDRHRPDQLVVSEHRHEETRPSTQFGYDHSLSLFRRAEFL